ncbi:MAG TPA: Uma2 family endonuclease [Daejeonella sp.]|nr:Uma2 family endonuclease [Daejeonella sp.]
MLTAEKKKFTKEDYQSLGEGAAFQLINADLVMSPSPTSYHQILSARIFKLIDSYLEQFNVGGICLFAPLDVHLDDENIFQPDLIYIPEVRKAELVKDCIEGAPDLIIEILSPATAYYDLRQKKDVYERYGVKEYIIIDPIQLNGEVYSLENGLFLLRQKAGKSELLQSVLLKGLEIDLNLLFK